MIDDSIEVDDSVLQELVHSGEELGRLQRALALLPQAWQDSWLMRLQGKKQYEIGQVMGWTQPNTYYVLDRAQRALKLLLSLPDITEESIEEDLSPRLSPELVLTLQVYYRTANFKRVSEALDYSGTPRNISNYARCRIIRALKLLANVPEAMDYVTFFEAELDNPAWSHNDRGGWTNAERRELEAAQAVREFEASRVRP